MMNADPAPLAWKRYDIRALWLDEVDALQDFLRREWNAQHIFVRDRRLLDWQHRDESLRRYTFIGGVSRDTGAIDAILGFIPQWHFDANLPRRDVWLALWKSGDSAEPGLGTMLMKYVIDGMAPEFVGGLNIAAGALPIYRRLGFEIGALAHYYKINPLLDRYELVAGVEPPPVSRSDSQDPGFTSRRLDAGSLFTAHSGLAPGHPAKSAEYLLNRYLRHPTYEYQLWELSAAADVRALLAIRVCKARDSAALRVVDLVGDELALAGSGAFFENLLVEERAEFVDFYAHGIDAAPLHRAGFVRREPGGTIVVPNFFEPFLQKNVELTFAYLARDARTPRIFKGDADQDRPSQVLSCAS